jgi:hypothetical protein
LSPLPASAAALCGFLADEASAGKRTSTLGRRFAGYDTPTKITDVTGHKSLEMLKTYSRDAEAFVGHAGAGLL